MKFLEGGGQIAHLELGSAESEMRVSPLRFQANRFFEFFGSLLGLAFVFQGFSPSPR